MVPPLVVIFAIRITLTLISKPLTVKHIWNGICNTGGAERPQPQRTGIAVAAGGVNVAVTRPGEFKRRPELDSEFYYLCFLQRDYRSFNFDLGFRFRAQRYCLLKSVIELRPAIRITGRVFGNGADVDEVCTDHFRPTRGYR